VDYLGALKYLFFSKDNYFVRFDRNVPFVGVCVCIPTLERGNEKRETPGSMKNRGLKYLAEAKC
jgi:hypothetical protein